MNTQSVSRTESLAKTSRVLGILSSIFLVIAILLALWIRFSSFDEFKKLALLAWVGYAFIGNLITGLPGVIVAIIALRRNNVEEDDPNIKKMATTGLILSILGIVVAVIFFIVAWIFSSNNPPPPIVTPVPSTTVP